MNLLLLIVSLSWTTFVAIPSDVENEIRWNDRSKIAYDDFKGVVPENSPWAALTASYIYFTYSTTNGKISTVKVYSAFKKNESWMKTNREDVLGHEQLHFAIAEYYTRKLYADAQLLKEKPGDISVAANKLFKSINEACDQLQQTYDSETEHGVKTEEQARWKKKVESMLDEYEAYPVITD
ncbi:MAG: DUF922 domain-containing protein [Chitinophagales bacterium]